MAPDPVDVDVAVIGVGMHTFAASPGVTLREMVHHAGKGALDDAGVSFAAIGAVYVGYIFSPVMTGTRLVKEFGLTGVPVQHVENTSATGSAAFREAHLAVASGRVDMAMALAFDSHPYTADRGRDPDKGGGMPEMTKDSVEGSILPMAFFAMWARRRMHDYGTTAETMAEIAAKNWNHAALNPMATRQPRKPVDADRVLASTMIADPLTAMMGAPVGEGAACAILCRRDLAEKLAPGRPLVRVAASVMQSERYQPGHLFQGPVIGPSEMTRTAAQEAYEQAGLGPEDLDLVQVHDAFAIEELVYYELLGLCGDGDGDKLVQQGDTKLGGRIPFSTDGGLIGRGHPGGPTGIAQIWETTLQLRGEAGARQVEGAEVGLCHMVGGGSVAAVHILTREAPGG